MEVRFVPLLYTCFLPHTYSYNNLEMHWEVFAGVKMINIICNIFITIIAIYMSTIYGTVNQRIVEFIKGKKVVCNSGPQTQTECEMNIICIYFRG